LKKLLTPACATLVANVSLAHASEEKKFTLKHNFPLVFEILTGKFFGIFFSYKISFDFFFVFVGSILAKCEAGVTFNDVI
jgi:hypothetical protein